MWGRTGGGNRENQEAGEERVGGGSSKRAGSGRNRGKLCNNAEGLAAIEKRQETKMQSTGRGRFSFRRGGLSLMTVIIYYGNVWYV